MVDHRRAGRLCPNAECRSGYLYLDHVVGILPERHLNNGQPSLHAKLLAHAGPQEGDHVVHVGAGTGYYTAIMAHLVGRSGKVTAIELDPGLADRARVNLSSYPNVTVICGNGAAVPFDAADVIYVNAGATRPADAWLDGLSEGGRLILPLTMNRGFTRQRSNLANREARGGISDRASVTRISGAVDFAGRDLPMLRCARPAVRSRLGRGVREGRLAACHRAVPQQ